MDNKFAKPNNENKKFNLNIPIHSINESNSHQKNCLGEFIKETTPLILSLDLTDPI